MADELTVTLQVQYENGSAKVLINPGSINVTQTTQGLHAPIVTVNTTAEEDMAVGDIGTEGWLVMRNLDPTNYVTYGTKNTTGDNTMIAFGRIEAGEVMAARIEPGKTLRWQANTAAVKVQTWLFED